MKILSVSLMTVLLAVVLSSGCGVAQEEHDRTLARNKALQTMVNNLEKLTADQEQRQKALEVEIQKIRDGMASALAAQKADLQNKLDELAKTKAALEELEKMRKELEAARELDAKLRDSLKAMISAGQLEVVNVGGRLVIKMAAKILFPTGKATLTPVGTKALAQVAGILKDLDRHFQVAGHTDDVPGRNRRYDNWALSADRAAGVVRLLAKEGVPGKNLSAAGFSHFQPVASNRTANGKALNRRIEITLMPVVPAQVQE
ncbi:MAG: OmpA family protein [Polyangia bacterium]|jgi:chemotaxis protein MotB|nr:OmpA family protein [Polyangia bacterium]